MDNRSYLFYGRVTVGRSRLSLVPSSLRRTVSRVFWPLIARHLQEHPPPPAEEELDGTAIGRKPPSLTHPSEAVTPSLESAPVPMADKETNGANHAPESAEAMSFGNNASPDRGEASTGSMGDEPGGDGIDVSEGAVRSKSSSSSSEAETDESGGGGNGDVGQENLGNGLKDGGLLRHSCAAAEDGDVGVAPPSDHQQKFG